jgi:hypothetical protein
LVADRVYGCARDNRPVSELRSSLFTKVAPVLNVSDLEAEREFYEKLGHNNPAPGWGYRRLLLHSPSGFRVVLEGPNEQ